MIKRDVFQLSPLPLLLALCLLLNSNTVQAAPASLVVSPGELAGMSRIYAVDNDQFDFNDAYTVDNSASFAVGSFSRVAYYIELGPIGNTRWVWVSMDTFNANPTGLGVPRAGTGIVENGTLVSNLNVETNHLGVTAGTGLEGIIEFWASNYNPNGGGQFGSDNGRFDWKDSGGSTSNGHGSFQIFSFTNPAKTDAQTLFGITANGGSGIGDQPTGEPDWTFGPGTGSYAIRNLEIYVNVTSLAVDDTGSTSDDTVLTVVDPGTTASLLANDNGAPHSVSNSSPTSVEGASVLVASDGTFSYDPTTSPTLQALLPGQTLVDTFSYTIRDGSAPAALGGVTSELELWLDASDIDADGSPDSLAAGTPVTNWQDKSGKGRDFDDVIGDASYVTSSSHRRPAVNFDGDDALRMNAAHNPRTFIDGNGEYTLITVARYSGGNRNRVISARTGHNWLFGFHGNSVNRWYSDGWGSLDVGGAITNNLDWHVHMNLMNVFGDVSNPAGDYYLDGDLLTDDGRGTGNGFANNVPDGLSLGAWNGLGEASTAEVSEVIMYNRVLTEPERLAVEGYLNDKYFGTTATVTITVSGSDNPLLAEDDGYTTDEGTAIVVPEFSNLMELNSLTTGDYAVTADGETFDAFVDNDGTNSWLLVGRGRQGWAWTDAGLGSVGDVNDNLGTPAAFTPAYYRSAIINDLITSAGFDLTDIEIRIKRAADPAGASYQEDRWRHTAQTAWDWVFPNPSQAAVVHEIVSGPFGTLGAHNANTHDEGGNNWQRIFTWAWGGHANQQGFSYGSAINNGSNNATSFLWENGNENHAIPYTEVYIRATAASGGNASLLANDVDPDTPFFISSIDTTGTLGLVNVPTGITGGTGNFEYDPNGMFESLNVGDTATDTFTYTVTEIEPPFARFVRVENNGGAIRRMDIGEIEVFEFGVTPIVGNAGGSGALNPTIDLATLANGATVHSQTASQPHGGNTTTIINGAENGGGSTWSSNGVGNFVVIDLGASFSLGSVRVHQRNDGCCQDRLRDFTVSMLADSGGSPGAVVQSGVFATQPANNSFGEPAFAPILGAAETATVTMTITGVNDPPVLTSPIPDQLIMTSNPTVDVSLFDYFEDVDNDDDEQIYTVTINTNGVLIQTDPINSVNGILTINTPCTLIGTAEITIEVEDTGAETITDTFTVTVTDDVGPVISCAQDMFYNVPVGMTATANFGSVTAWDKVDPAPTLGFVPNASFAFPIGSTLVTCTATDASLNETIETFYVHVFEIQLTAGTRVLDVVSLRGDAAPDAGGSAGVPAGSSVLVHQAAALNNNGDILYTAALSDAGTNNRAVFRWDASGDEALAVRNIPVPGGSGANYGTFSELAINNGSASTFQSATSAGNGNFLHDGTTVSDAALAGTTAAGTTGNYRVLRKPAITSGGEVLTVSNLKTGVGGITAADDTGVWLSGSAVALAREGGLSPITNTDHGQIHPRVVASAAGNQVAFTSYLLEQGGFDGTDNTAIFAGPPSGPLVEIVREGAASPGETGVEIETITGESVNSSGSVAFIGNVRGTGITSANNAGLWWSDGTTIRSIAREGALAPCLPVADEVFARFKRIYNCDDGSVFFYAYLKSATGSPVVNSTNDGSIWRYDTVGGGLHLVARESHVALSTDGSQLGTLLDFDCNQVGGIVYLATFVANIGDTTSKVRDGVWLARDSSDVAPVLVMRRGDNFDISGEEHVVSNIKLNAQSNPGGGTGGYGKVINDSGEILLNLSLNKNKSGLFKMQMP
ncbi:MAG: VCBS repeat-containing protein [Verrucomicrobiales bacterium]|jgi:VCBS repeat-containing protein